MTINVDVKTVAVRIDLGVLVVQLGTTNASTLRSMERMIKERAIFSFPLATLMGTVEFMGSIVRVEASRQKTIFELSLKMASLVHHFQCP